MITALFALATTSLAPQSPPSTTPSYGATLYARDEHGFTPVCGLVGVSEIVLPMQTRSEAQPRIARGQRSVTLRIAAPSTTPISIDWLELAWVRHASEERIVATPDGKGLRLLADIELPRSVVRATGTTSRPETATGEELLPWYARQDGVSGPSVAIEVAAPGPERQLKLVLQGVERRAGWAHDGWAPAGPTKAEHDTQLALGARPWDVQWKESWRADGRFIHLDSGDIDQIVWAHVLDIDPSRRQRAALAKVRVARVAEWKRGAFRPSALRWAEIVRTSEFADAQPRDVSDRVDTHDERAWTLEAGAIAEIELPLPSEAPAGQTWSLTARYATDERDALEPQPRASEPSAMFRDVAREAGIDMVHMEGPDLQLDIRPTMGPGAAWGDVDGDGWVDLFLPQGGGREGSRVAAAKLYRNKRDGTFEDVTKRANLALEGGGMGALFLDVDGDRDLDLFVAAYGRNRLLLNDGSGVFRDVTTQVGVPPDERWHAAVSAADFDADGDLDLYVTSYLEYDPSKMPPADELGRYQREDPLEMLPFAFPGQKKTFLRNDGLADGRRKGGPSEASAPIDAGGAPSAPSAPSFHLTDVTDELKVGDENGRGMQAIFWDFDRDGDQDLYVANDVSPNTFFRNEGDGRFKDISLATGLDDPRGCMGLSVGDIDGDLDEDLFVTNWELESNALYVNNLRHTSSKSRVSTFRDQSVSAGLAQLSIGTTGWGCELADFDLDGDLDLFYANGYTSPDYESTGICVGQPCHYFEGDGAGKFTAAFAKAGPDVALALSARCALACDYDQDGDLDLVVTANNGRVRLLRNETPHGKHWLGVRLRGKDGNTFAIGAEVRVRTGERTQLRSLRAGTSYLGGNAPELHFGLGDAARIDELVVRWPTGKETTHTIEAVDRFVALEEPR